MGSLSEPLFVVDRNGTTLVGKGGHLDTASDATVGLAVRALVPPCLPEHLGDAGFVRDHGLRLPYVAGAMANGIGSCEVVEAMGQAGMLGFFGAAGLMPEVVEDAIDRISAKLGDKPYGFNLIHSPYEPELEGRIVDLYLRRGVRLVSASAYLDLTLPLIRYRVHGIHRDPESRVITPNRVIAKISRIEVARKFFSPPPEQMLRELGLSNVRVRYHHDDLARLEVALDELPVLCASDVRPQVVERLRELGFRYVTIDLEGFRSGSFQQLVSAEELIRFGK